MGYGICIAHLNQLDNPQP